jgi:hypothetical protein
VTVKRSSPESGLNIDEAGCDIFGRLRIRADADAVCREEDLEASEMTGQDWKAARHIFCKSTRPLKEISEIIIRMEHYPDVCVNRI